MISSILVAMTSQGQKDNVKAASSIPTESRVEIAGARAERPLDDQRDPLDRLLDAGAETAARIEDEFQKILAKSGGIGTLMNAAVYNDLSMPAGFMERFRDAIVWLNQLAGEKSIGSGFGGRTGDKTTADEKREQQEQDSEDSFEQLRSHFDQIQEQERERAEWSRSMHSYAGMDMSGEEWGAFADELKADTPLRRWLVEQFKKKGKPEAEAQKQADQVSLLAKMQSLPPSQWTDEMKALDAELDANPEKRAELDEALRDANKMRHSPDLSAAQSAKVAKAASGGLETSIEARADMLSGGAQFASDVTATQLASTSPPIKDRLFSSAPILTNHYDQALAATEPLDKAKEPARIAMAAPAPAAMPAASGGFDV